jgi:pimeloyl-ACP methyl ester carboxylesterase
MLDQLGINGPVVLVGHSVGSLDIRMYAARHLHRVAGMVHVDGSIFALRLWPGQPVSVDGDRPDSSPIDRDADEREMRVLQLPEVPGVVLACTPGRLGRWRVHRGCSEPSIRASGSWAVGP